MWSVYLNNKVYTPKNILSFYNVNKHTAMRIEYDGELILDYKPSSTCQCGRYWDDNPKKTFFQAKYTAYVNSTAFDGRKRILQSPELCMLCYYQQALDADDWVPKEIKDLLRLDL